MGHPQYLTERRRARKFVGAPISCSVIGWRDKRWRSQSSVTQLVRLRNYAHYVIMPTIALPDNTPVAFSLLCKAFACSRLQYTLRKSHDIGLRKYSSEILGWNKLFDDSMITSAREWGESGRRAIILCGGIHALTIHRSTGWPMLHLAETAENMRELTRQTVANVLYPEKVLGVTHSILLPA